MYTPKTFLVNALAILGVICLIVGLKYATDYLKKTGIIEGVERDNNPFIPSKPFDSDEDSDSDLDAESESESAVDPINYDSFPELGTDPEAPVARSDDIDTYLL